MNDKLASHTFFTLPQQQKIQPGFFGEHQYDGLVATKDKSFVISYQVSIPIGELHL